MLCVNPDIVIYRQGGVIAPCAGWLARHYREAYGGRVLYHGKPDPAIFRRAAQALGQSDDARILVVGDSLATDIEGAIAAGYDSLFVTRGIHAEELGIAPGAEPDPSAWPKSARATANGRPWRSPPYAGKATMAWHGATQRRYRRMPGRLGRGSWPMYNIKDRRRIGFHGRPILRRRPRSGADT